ncbi:MULTISPECIES: IS21 family transposase [Bacillota]|uniref:IS21 family transposase n=1 Tax=Bacillota TaxID=1239 RepID=UPI00266F562A|nr:MULTISPECIES: IS21 family transposase [Bacillota]
MAQIDYIKDLYENEDLSLREISRRTGHSFQTVQKYAYQEDWSAEQLPNLEAENYPNLEKYIPSIDEWMEADRKLPRKQRHTAMRIYHRLVEEQGYRGSYSSVKRYVRKKKFVLRLATEGYLPLAQPRGHGQVDFGESLYYDSQSRERKGYALTVSFPQSNKGYTQFFPSQNQECLLEGLKRVFEHIGGVPPRLRFDNLSTAVVKVLEGGERELTEGFTRFMLHYRFRAEFCNPAAGNEKGNVENKVGYSRRNAFVPVPTVTSFEEFNEWLWEWCEKDAQRLHYKYKVPIQELWEADRDALLKLPEYPFPVFRYEALSVNKYGFAVIDTNKYGLAPTLAGKTVQAKIFFDHVEFYHDHQPVGRYRRSYGRDEELYDWTQYVGTLLKKPGAVEHTRFFKQLPQQWQELLAQSRGRERKGALRLLDEIVRDGNAPLCEDALSMAAENGRTDPDSIRQCYYMIARKEFRPKPLELRASTPKLRYDPNLTAYDGLTGGASHA